MMAFMNSGLPTKARPVIFLIDVAEGKDEACKFLKELLKELKRLNKKQETIMISIILYSHNSHSLKVYWDIAIRNSIVDYTQKYEFIEFLSQIKELYLPIYKADSIKENDLQFFFNQYVYECQSFSLNNKDYIEPILDIADRIIFYLPNNWLNSCVVIIDNSLTSQKRTQINDYKMEGFLHMIRLYTSNISMKKICNLARDILQYVEPKPIPRVKKKNVGDCLTIQIPVLEGALYDND